MIQFANLGIWVVSERKESSGMVFQLQEVPSPIGTLFVVTEGETLRAVDFQDGRSRLNRLLERHYGTVELEVGDQPSEVARRISAYFEGDIESLESIVVATNGSSFQKAVWDLLRSVPAGETVSYGWIANRLGNPNASRAVGLANGSNPISIVVPCHRVIGANRKLTGYAGGLARKQWLLDFEKGIQWKRNRK
jgi:methylated-DNA-[protein]-cysteine S-methyltransferase